MRGEQFVILCLDDDPDILESLKLILEANEYIFVSAANGEQGLKKYKEVAPDFVIVDLMMEEVDAGTNFVKEIKALGNTAPVYMLSSVGDQMSMSIDTTELGLAGVFQKPINSATLLGTLKLRLKK